MSSYLITGAGRGLGLELASQLSRRPRSEVSFVFATTRTTVPDALKSLIESSDGRVVHVPLQIRDRTSIERAVASVSDKLEDRALDVLINNAGVMHFTPDGIANMNGLREAFEVNVEAVHSVTSGFLSNMKKGGEKKVINISTTLGSIAYSPTYAMMPIPAYKISKAALDMLTVQYAHELGKDGFTFLAVTPGWLRTDLGGDQADLSVEEGAKATIDVIFNNGHESNGKFLNIYVPGWEKPRGVNNNFYNGKEVPW
ncbi:hypothetical protein LTR37_003508 [Vermiconidia calcicola]|uniref:Uncharacterized protein n=1 Tax=Vermiconidia calcicola TaxID=1690605 RepID=A0ACC3NQ19_9PEZI|nr:hypothetical protein LTR37_003508 [Vermiconidia calcicola]